MRVEVVDMVCVDLRVGLCDRVQLTNSWLVPLS